MNKALIAGVAVASLAGYLLAWPVKVQPQAWTPPPAPALTGVYQANDVLKATQRIDLGIYGHRGPEDVAIGPDGKLYAGTDDGNILRMALDGNNQQVFANTGGRPLGLRFDAAGNLIVADAYKGLLSVDAKGVISVLTATDGHTPLNFADDLDIASDGKIYFSEASSRFPLADYESDFIEHRGNGRLLVYNPQDRSTRVLLDGLYFANGVAVSPDRQFVLVAETGKYRVRRYWLQGPQAGRDDIFIDNLPGMPDGVLSNGKDTFWLTLATPRLADLDQVLPHPWLRRIVARLPKALSPKPQPYGFVLGLNAAGQVTHNLQDPGSNAYSTITNVIEHDGKLYFGSLHEAAIGVFPLAKAKP